MIPDYWVVVKFPGVYKLLGGTSGGFLDGDIWQLNSGIVSVEEDGEYLLFHGNSGSVYKCHKAVYKIGVATAVVAVQIEESGGVVMDDMDWLTFKF